MIFGGRSNQGDINEAVLLDFKNIKVKGDGSIIDELPIILIDVKFNATIFKP